jgi:hypothetical protein
METHKRVLGILYIVSGAFQILGMLILSAVMGIILPFVIDQAELQDQWVVMWLIPLLRVIGVSIIILFAIPAIIGGVGVLYHKRWALTLVMVLGCFKLLSFPIGTALGIYSIWVYAEDHRLSKLNS